MPTRSHSAVADSNVGSRTEPEFELTDEQWNLSHLTCLTIRRLFGWPRERLPPLL